MAKTIEINGKNYIVPEVDFNAICELADRGVDVMNPQSMGKRPIPAARAISAWILNTDLETAGDEIQKHIIGGGDISSILTVFIEAIEDSGFIKALSNKTEVEAQAEEKKNPKKKAQ